MLEILPYNSGLFYMHLSFMSLGSFLYVFGFPRVSLTIGISGILFPLYYVLPCFVLLCFALFVCQGYSMWVFLAVRLPICMGSSLC